MLQCFYTEPRIEHKLLISAFRPDSVGWSWILWWPGKEALSSTKVSGVGSKQGLQLIISSTGQGVWPRTGGLPPMPQRDEGVGVGRGVGRRQGNQWKTSASFKNHDFKHLYLLIFDVLGQGLANFTSLAKSCSLPVLGIKFYWHAAMPIPSCCLGSTTTELSSCDRDVRVAGAACGPMFWHKQAICSGNA